MNIHIGWPEAIYLVLNILSLPPLAYKLADEAKGCAALACLVMWVFLTLPLLYWGGFFA
jgi:hypothetical protein